MKVEMALILLLLFIIGLLSACGPTEEEQNATVTQIVAGIYLTQTAGAPTPTAVPTETPSPTKTPTPISPTEETQAVLVPDLPKICAVLDTGGEYDRSFNELTLRGAQEAATAEGLPIYYVVSEAMTDYEDNITSFVNEGCGLIITVGFLMADVTAAAARANPDVHFAIVDVVYWPGFGCDPSLNDCYEEDLNNLTSLMFSEYEAGYLVGVLAGCMSESGVIGSVSGMEIPPVVNFVVGYQEGARSENPDIETLNVYIQDFNDPATGLQAGQQMIAAGADIIFGVGGNTGNGGLLAAHEAGVWGIGVDVDQYYTYPDVAMSLLTSAVKQIDEMVYDAVIAFSNNSLQAGIFLGTVANDGVGVAPYHSQANNIPDACRAAVDSARESLPATGGG